MKVFLSSTYIDLIEHRKAAANALRTMDEEVGNMEVFGARDDEATKVSLEELDKCDVLVGVYAYRYGTVPAGSKTSVTEQEYLYAMSKKIPVLVFVVDESHPWPPKLMDKSQAEIEKFKSKATAEHTPDYFTSPDNLAQKVVSSVGRLAKRLAQKPSPNSQSPLTNHQLPTGSTLPTQPYFFGRADELKIIASALSPESRTWGALIDGPGGIGKTALAIKAAHDAPTTLFERKIFISAKVREMTPEGEKPLVDFRRDNYFSMINELALELGEDRIPRLAPDERANPLRMAMAGKKTLIVFDNLETLSEDERTRLFQFLSRLPEGNKAIATSRRGRRDIDARSVRLDRLQRDEALRLIEKIAETHPRLDREKKEEYQRLYEITNGNPLLIKWVCGQLGREGTSMRTIAEACRFIENAPKGNDPLEYIFGDLLETFTDSETKVLAALTYFTQPANPKWVANITNLSEQATETTLQDLSDRSLLLSTNGFPHFFLPPLAAQFIRTNCAETVAKVGELLNEHAYTQITKHGGAKNYEGFKILDEEWPFISAAIPLLIAQKNDLLQVVCRDLLFFLNFTGRWDERIVLCEHAEKKAIASGDLEIAGWRAYQIGWIQSQRKQFVEVWDCADRAEKFFQNSGAHEKGFAQRLRGNAYTLKKDYPQAIIAFQKTIELWSLTDPESQDMAIVMNSLGKLHKEINDFAASESYFHKALAINIKNNDEEGIAIETGNLSEMSLYKDDWKKAETLGMDSLILAEKIGHKELIAHDNWCISVSILRQGFPSEALSYAKRAVEIYVSLSHEDVNKAKKILDEIEQNIKRF